LTEQDKKEIAQSFIRGLGNRDANLLRSIMTEDVVWSLPGNRRVELVEQSNAALDSSGRITSRDQNRLGPPCSKSSGDGANASGPKLEFAKMREVRCFAQDRRAVPNDGRTNTSHRF
jgi:hypothetical protein